jgi:copper chaperone CopZ
MTTFHIPDMSCGHCKATVEKTIHALDPEAQIEFDMAARRISVESSTDAVRVETALADAGYPAASV